MKGLVIQSTGKEYKVKTENNEILTCFARGKFRQNKFKTTNPIAVGDYVEVQIEDNTAPVIKQIHDRKNYILRKSVNLSKQTQILASNIDRAFFVFTFKNPETNIVFLDRFLAIAESFSVEVIILFNKADLLDEDDKEVVEAIMGMYQAIGYKTILTSTETLDGIEEVSSIMRNGVSVFIGNSGVGKSSLIKAIDPELTIKIKEISEYHKQGKHTTIFAQMFDIKGGGQLIDTPGIRGIDFYDTKKEEIYHYFKDIFHYSENCKFHNCVHLKEPQCAVRQAVENGEISESRYNSYIKIITDTEDKYR